MVKSRILLMPFAMLAMAFVALAPASALERTTEPLTIEMHDPGFDLAYVAIDVADVVEMRAVQPVAPAADASPVQAALGPIYALSLQTDGQSLFPLHHMRC